MNGMSKFSILVLGMCVALGLAACQKSSAPVESAVPTEAPVSAEAVQSVEPVPPPEAAPAAAPSFINKVWRVKDASSIPGGGLYVFVSDGTMLITSPNSKPALGAWNQNDGQLTWIEEGRPYKVDVLSIDAMQFHVRVNSPGDPVDILFELAP